LITGKQKNTGMKWEGRLLKVWAFWKQEWDTLYVQHTKFTFLQTLSCAVIVDSNQNIIVEMSRIYRIQRHDKQEIELWLRTYIRHQPIELNQWYLESSYVVSASSAIHFSQVSKSTTNSFPQGARDCVWGWEMKFN